VTLDDNLQPQPWAATSWEWVDPLTVRFHLRNDLTFSNGDKLTADDVEFTVNYFVETKTPPISRFRSIASAKKVDDYTVDLINSVPDASTLPATSYMIIIPKKYFQSVGTKGFAAAPIGSGPYVLAEHQPNVLQRFTLRPEPHPFRKPQPKEIDLLGMPDTSAVIAGLRTGDIDIAVTVPFVSDQLDSLAKNGLTFQKQLTGNAQYIFPWPTWQKANTPLSNVKVRQALNYAVDKQTLNQKLYRGEAKPSHNLVAPGSPFYDDSLQAFPYDPAKAKQLLAEAGYPNGFKLPTGIGYNVGPDVAQAIQGYLRDIGVDAPLAMVEYGTYVDQFNGKQASPDILQIGMIDPDGFNSSVRAYYSCTFAGAPFYCNPDFDKASAAAAAESDATKRNALFKQSLKIITDDVMTIYLLETPSYAAVSPKIKGFTYTISPYYEYEKAYRID
jgi:peptide/nickel transport system substrate-binding protein